MAVDVAVGRPAAVRIPQRPPWWGTRAEQREALVALLGSSAVVAVYVAVARALGAPPTALEVVGTVLSLAGVWITRTRNLLNMPLGVVSVVASGVFFFGIGLVGQGWLHLGYYIPVQLWGWWHWARGGPARTAAPVRSMTWPARWGVVVLLVAGTAASTWLLGALHGPSPTLAWDSSIVAASVLAQTLLSAKRVETWWLWLVPVDVSGIALYVSTGAYLFAALYVVFLALATHGLVLWVRSLRAERA